MFNFLNFISNKGDKSNLIESLLSMYSNEWEDVGFLPSKNNAIRFPVPKKDLFDILRDINRAPGAMQWK